MRTNLDDSQGSSNYESSQGPDTQDQPEGPPSKAVVDAAERLRAKRESATGYTGNLSNDVLWTGTHCPVYLTSNRVSVTPVRPHDSSAMVSGVSGRNAATRGERGSSGTHVSSHGRRSDDPTVSPGPVFGVSNIAAATRTDKSGSSVGVYTVPSASVTHDDQIGDTNRGDQSVFSTAPSVAATRVDYLGSASSSRRRSDVPTDGDHRFVSPLSVLGVSGNVATTRAEQASSACDDSNVSGRWRDEGVSSMSGGEYRHVAASSYVDPSCVTSAHTRPTVFSVAATGGELLGAARASVSSFRRRGDEPTDGHHRFVSPLSIPGATRAEQGGSAGDVSNVSGRWNAVPPRFGGKATVEAAPRLQHAGTSATTTREDIPGNTQSVTHASVAVTRRLTQLVFSVHLLQFQG